MQKFLKSAPQTLELIKLLSKMFGWKRSLHIIATNTPRHQQEVIKNKGGKKYFDCGIQFYNIS